MRDIRIHDLTLENFKCHDSLRLELGGADGALAGDNGVGKTSVYDAFVWLLWGGDSLGGSEKVIEVKPLTPSGAVRDHRAVTTVEAGLTVDGEPLRFRRSYRELWSGETFGGHTSEYAVDGVPCRKQEFTRRVEELAPEEVFRVLTGVHFFARDLDWQRRRELLCRAARVPEDRALMAGKPEFAGLLTAMGDKTPGEYRRWLKAQVRDLTLAGNDLPARISECRRSLRQVEGLDFPSARERLADLKGKEAALNAMLCDPAAGADRARLESTKARRDSLLRETKHYREALDDLQERRKRLRGRVFHGGVCPTCGQALPAEQVTAARERFREELRREAEELENRETRLRREALRAREALGTVEEEVKALQAKLPADPGEEVRRQLSEVRREKERLQGILDQEALKTYAEKRLEELGQQERKAAELLEEYQTRLGELDSFSRFRASLLEESVNALFREVRFRLFREKVGGGLEERCDVTVQGVPYINVNNGGRVRAGMDIIRAMSELWQVKLPLFLDNAEGVTRLPETACQRIALRVAPGPLRLEREEEGTWQADRLTRYM